jgi:intergrase/recombinase
MNIVDRIIMKRHVKKLKRVIKFSNDMGWDLLIPEGGGPDDDGILRGIIMGEKAYVNYVVKCLEG